MANLLKKLRLLTDTCRKMDNRHSFYDCLQSALRNVFEYKLLYFETEVIEIQIKPVNFEISSHFVFQIKPVIRKLLIDLVAVIEKKSYICTL